MDKFNYIFRKLNRIPFRRKKPDIFLIKHRNFVIFQSSFSKKDENYYKKDPSDYKVVFIGSDTFSLPTLLALTRLLKAGNLAVVVSKENNLVGKFAKKQNQPIYLWEDFKKKNWPREVEGTPSFDFGIVASFGYLIPARVIDRFPLGIFNVHASLLPRWRGASPINHAIIHGDKSTGISIMKIAPHHFDIGPVLRQSSVPLDDHMKASDLLKILSEVGANALLQVLSDLPGHLKNPVKQDNSLATSAPKLLLEIAQVNWPSRNSLQIYRLYRGLHGVYKLRTTYLGKKVDLDEIEDIPSSSFSIFKLPLEATPGDIVFLKSHNLICVRCHNSTWISIRKLKVAARWMSAKDFSNGYLSKSNSSLVTPHFTFNHENSEISLEKLKTSSS